MTGQTDTDIAALRNIAYGYSLRDNLTSAGDLLDPAQDVSYSYDARQMLDGSTGPWGALGYTYDPVGNRATRSLTPPGGSASLDTYTYELTSNGLDTIDNLATGTRGYSYDGAGNTVGELRALAVTDNWSYAYNNAGRLASVSLNGGLQAEYVYNALGQQVGRTVGSGPSAVVTLSVHDLNGNRIAEHDDTGAVIREYIWLDGRPLAVVEGGQTYQLHWDQIGRPVMATDATGAMVWAASYLPFGGIDQVWVDTLAIEQNLRFPGQWFQAETGLHQNWHRDYDPTTGRYLQADPLGLVDGPSVYGYARMSPVVWIDPWGLWRLPDYIAVNINIAIPTPWTGTVVGWSGTASVNRYGDVFWSPAGAGIGKTLTFVSASLTANWLNQDCLPSQTKLADFLSGNGFNAALGFWGGVSESYTPGSGFATGIGLVTPQGGISYNYSFHGGNIGVQW